VKEQKSFELTASSGKNSSAILNLHHWDKMQANAKALKWAGSVLGFGLLTIFIPIVHFVSVPGAIIATPVVYLVVSKLFASGTEFKGSAKCPDCAAELHLDGACKDWPHYVNCDNCRTSIKIEPR